ncbi:LOB domain-containing protein 41-like [Cucumis melo var. makuwa]|uniref:LOB domain-containing protein 41-like n=2 Tax=Cucumis melo TaxID=3656 RepID=A0A5A7UQD2_CUCMM|nr:LOB domain-containing protein 41-like [Cucumis melo var. makuwa]TYK28425.1 LOB domain-containing protein 41-like [Cucumis melo var. makuwa]
MRMSCNGCRVLRKGCSESCSIRPCLQWIKSPQSQANATFFLAKFYGRAGLVNLINAGPDHLRPAIFKSLLFEACGRIVNPIFGSAGLLWSGSWQLCQDAVEAVLKGAPILPVSSETAASHMGPPLKGCDIRHVSKQQGSASASAVRKIKTRRRFKRSGTANKLKPKEEPGVVAVPEFIFDDQTRIVSEPRCLKFELDNWKGGEWPEKECGSDDTECLSVETVEGCQGGDVELELTLGFGQSRMLT